MAKPARKALRPAGAGGGKGRFVPLAPRKQSSPSTFSAGCWARSVPGT